MWQIVDVNKTNWLIISHAGNQFCVINHSELSLNMIEEVSGNRISYFE